MATLSPSALAALTVVPLFLLVRVLTRSVPAAAVLVDETTMSRNVGTPSPA